MGSDDRDVLSSDVDDEDRWRSRPLRRLRGPRGALAMVVAFAIGVVGGIIVTRVSGIAFAIITLAVGVVISVIVAQLEFVGGGRGLSAVPFPRIAGKELLGSNESIYLFALIVSLLSYLVLHAVTASPYGRLLQAIRDNRTRAQFIGVDVQRYQVVAYAISAIWGGIGGAVFVVIKGGMGIDQFSWSNSGEALIILIVGGMATLWGSFIGALIFVFASNYLTSGLAETWKLYFGLIFVALVLVAPKGIAGLPSYIAAGGRRLLAWRRSSK